MKKWGLVCPPVLLPPAAAAPVLLRFCYCCRCCSTGRWDSGAAAGRCKIRRIFERGHTTRRGRRAPPMGRHAVTVHRSHVHTTAQQKTFTDLIPPHTSSHAPCPLPSLSLLSLFLLLLSLLPLFLLPLSLSLSLSRSLSLPPRPASRRRRRGRRSSGRRPSSVARRHGVRDGALPSTRPRRPSKYTLVFCGGIGGAHLVRVVVLFRGW